jgi:hypothetical protein
MGAISTIIWLTLAFGATYAGYLERETLEVNNGIIPSLIFVWAVTILGMLPSPARKIIAAPVVWLRRRPILYWFVLLIYISFALTLWTVKYQPTNGRWITPVEYCLLLIAVWGLWYLIRYGATREAAYEMGAKLAKSKLAGVMITLTTFIVLFAAAETWMRINYITTDAYGFTSMNYYWYTNFYWNDFNSLGYRDYEPTPDDPNNPLTRIAIVGDSFAVGHGLNNKDDSFPQMLERDLGEGYDVNLIAQSGWDSDVEEFHLDNYPYRPNVVILSYYLNDIDYLLTAPETNPDENFTFIDDPVLSSFIRDWFFVPNYIYYNLLQFTSSQRNSSFVNDLIGAHMNDAVWNQQAMQLDSFINWTRNNNARLIVLLWPNLAGIDLSIPALERITAFFEEHGVQVIDMSDTLRPYPVLEMIVNRFDTHPGVLAQRLAADSLAEAIRANIEND